jgi:hypothetical protein
VDLPNWSERVLKTNATVFPEGSYFTSTSMSLESTAFYRRGLRGDGIKLIIFLRSSSVPRPVKAVPQTTGHNPGS